MTIGERIQLRVEAIGATKAASATVYFTDGSYTYVNLATHPLADAPADNVTQINISGYPITSDNDCDHEDYCEQCKHCSGDCATCDQCAWCNSCDEYH